MFIVTGATGALGRAVVEQLLDRVPADQVGVSVRDPERARDLAERGVRVRRGDFAEPETLASALEGATQVLVVSANELGDKAVRLNRAAVDAAVAAGAERVLYTSHMGASATSAFPPMLTHAATEQALQDCGTPFTSLRNGFYASSAVQLLRRGLETGELALPEDGPVAWTAHADLAEATAVTLVSHGLVGLTPALTGAEVLDMGDAARLLSEVTGRPVRRTVVGDEEFRAGLIAAGLPEPVADLSLGMFVASRAGEFAPADATLTRLVGHEPVPFRSVLEEAFVR